MQLLFSATFNDKFKEMIAKFITKYKPYYVDKEILKLEGVKHF